MEIFIAIAVLGIAGWIFHLRGECKTTRVELNQVSLSLRQGNDTIASLKEELSRAGVHAHNLEVQARKADKKTDEMRALLRETSTFYPTLASAVAQLEVVQLESAARTLRTKKRPAIKKASDVDALVKEVRQSIKTHNLTLHRLKYYEHHYPFVTELDGLTIDEIIENHKREIKQSNEANDDEQARDPTGHWLSKEEWSRLEPGKRSQLALDRYLNSRKSSHQIGRDYERYCGYLLEQKGYRVEYFGIQEGFDDLGRDLIARKGKQTIIIQCKNWAAHKTIHEKHIFQLYGTFMEYRFRAQTCAEASEDVSAVFMTSTGVSDRARRFARFLGVKVEDNLKFDKDYPIIKCNVGSEGAQIYHLPFDQMYDRVVVEPHKGERYVRTASEAEELGFRRAYRWYGAN